MKYLYLGFLRSMTIPHNKKNIGHGKINNRIKLLFPAFILEICFYITKHVIDVMSNDPYSNTKKVNIFYIKTYPCLHPHIRPWSLYRFRALVCDHCS